MSMHKKPLTEIEEKGLKAHGLAIGTPSQLSDCFRLGMQWQEDNGEDLIRDSAIEMLQNLRDEQQPLPPEFQNIIDYNFFDLVS